VTLRLALALLLLAGPAIAAAQSAGAQGMGTWLGELSSLDFRTRMNAARQIRRVAAGTAVPALVEAVRTHSDQFVRYRALVILTGFNDDRITSELMKSVMRDRNDRLRELAYKWLEEHPDPALTAALLATLQTEEAEFVRPALVGALAALGADAQVQRALVNESGRGLDFFRSAVIDSLGRHRARYATTTLMPMLANDGPLRDDVVLALGRIGDPDAVPALEGLSVASPDVLLTARAALCLLGRECDEHLKALTTAAASADRVTARSAVAAMTAIALGGRPASIDVLLRIASATPALKGDVGAALGTIAVRLPDTLLVWLDGLPMDVQSVAIGLLKDGFDGLEEDFGEERFFAAARTFYWKAADGSPSRTMASTLIERLEF
jgi:HEAT repeat protein